MKPSHILGPEGPFVARRPGFAPRADQQQLADVIAQCIAEKDTLIAEAGTGVGKTYAYLVALIQSGQKGIVSTGTRTLQDQLFHRDVPDVLAALALNVRTALLKGRSNYLCLYRLKSAQESAEIRSDQESLEDIDRWAHATKTGDLVELSGLPDNSPLRGQVTSTADNCLSRRCPNFDDCYVFKARRKAQDADLVVVNHHLLFADFALKESGYGDLLPDADVFVLDEAHQIPDTAATYFGTTVSRARLSDLARDALSEAGQVDGASVTVADAAYELQREVRVFRESLERYPERGAWRPMLNDEQVLQALNVLIDALLALRAVLAALAESSPGLESCARRATDMANGLEKHTAVALPGEVHWYERRGRGFLLHSTPVEVAEPLSALRAGIKASWIFTSATLAVGESFALYQRQLGLEEARTCQFAGPFDYQNQALLYLPPNLPAPGSFNHAEAVFETCRQLLPLTGGRAFVLFTSHRALRSVAERLRALGEYPLFVQGEAPRSRLLKSFVASGDGVLLGAASFWEGVDVAGPALSCVIIDKLPFASPDDPLTQARIDSLRESGEQPFMTLQLPQAVLALKQGIGRLIRGMDDRGLAVVCDSRLKSKGYGKKFLAALPPMPVTDDFSEIKEYCRTTIPDVRS